MHVQRVLKEGLLYPEQVYSSELKCHCNQDDLYHGNQDDFYHGNHEAKRIHNSLDNMHPPSIHPTLATPTSLGYGGHLP